MFQTSLTLSSPSIRKRMSRHSLLRALRVCYDPTDACHAVLPPQMARDALPCESSEKMKLQVEPSGRFFCLQCHFLAMPSLHPIFELLLRCPRCHRSARRFRGSPAWAIASSRLTPPFLPRPPTPEQYSFQSSPRCLGLPHVSEA